MVFPSPAFFARKVGGQSVLVVGCYLSVYVLGHINHKCMGGMHCITIVIEAS